MFNVSKLEGYMINLGITFEALDDNAWIVNDAERGLEKVVIVADDPLVIVRVKIMEIPENNREKLFEKLLQLNASDLVHGAYAIEDDHVILVDTLEYSTMDLEEFQASLDSVSLALTQHYSILSDLR